MQHGGGGTSRFFEEHPASLVEQRALPPRAQSLRSCAALAKHGAPLMDRDFGGAAMLTVTCSARKWLRCASAAGSPPSHRPRRSPPVIHSKYGRFEPRLAHDATPCGAKRHHALGPGRISFKSVPPLGPHFACGTEFDTAHCPYECQNFQLSNEIQYSLFAVLSRVQRGRQVSY
jgi:hypothetical protein